MKIELLLKRESFYEILNDTLQRYFFYKHNKTITIREYKDKRWGFPKDSLICNSRLNIIFHPKVSKFYFTQIRDEYSYNKNFLKRILQTLYVNVALTYPFSILFSDFIIILQPFLEQFNNQIIIGGNNRIRILDYQENKCFVILKSGFNNSYFTNEIKLRNTFHSETIPKLIEVNLKHNWFVEEIISGKPINRLHEEKLYYSALKKAFNVINELHEQTKNKVSSLIYIKNLVEEINKLLNSRIFERISDEVKHTVKLLSESIVLSNNFDLYISTTHGDFQSANILLDGTKIWIIDWENAKVRNSDYDIFTFFLDARNLSVFSQHFIEAYNNQKLKLSIDTNNINIKDFFRQRIIIFLIENLIYALEQNNNERFYSCDNYLIGYIKIMKDIVKKI